MTLHDEERLLHREVSKLRADKRRRYPEELRRRILGWVERATEAGAQEHECAKAIGVKTWRFTMWRKREAREARDEVGPLALVPVEVPALATVSEPVIVIAPSGYRIEGLSLMQLISLLRELA
jgi:hypothetical protein